jgi:hypothetical protein
MKKYRVKVIDGPLPSGIWQVPNMEPDHTNPPEHNEVLRELMAREPIFHRPEFGTTRKDFDKLMAPEFWETTASGRRVSRQFILDCLEKRYETTTEVTWEIEDFRCSEIAVNNYLVTYTLFQGERITRRAAIWRRTADDWQVVYHQGTVVLPS